MNRISPKLLIPLLLAAFAYSQAQEAIPEVIDPQSEEAQFNDTVFGAVAALSHSITSTTGIAMSPLLGMGAYGAWKYYKSDQGVRDQLPWYSNPWSWGIFLGIFLLLKSKDTLGAWIPEIVKKPITLLDDVAEKASALIVALAVIPPAVLAEMKEMVPQSAAGGPVAAAPIIVPIVAIVLAIAVFIVVWFAFSALSSIKILSPSSVVNTGISLVKGVIIAVFAGLVALNPVVGIAVSLAIIIGCAMIFGWAFRWNVFGALFVKDFFTGAFKQPLEKDEELKGFSTGNFPGVKSRTYGRITREGDELVFTWKPWLFMPAQKSRITISSGTSARKGIFVPAITLHDSEADRHRSIIDFRLRYRARAEEIQSRLLLDSMLPNPVLGGLQASWDWFRDQLNRGGTTFARALQ